MNLGTSSGVGDLLIRKWLREAVASRIFDFGCGAGRYGDIARVEVSEARLYACDTWQPAIDSVRAFDKYDTVFLGDLRSVVEQEAAQSCDLWIFGDVLEHIPKEDVRGVWAAANKSHRSIIVVIPLGKYPQGALYGNPREAHLWSCEVEDVHSWPLRILEIRILQATPTQSILHVLAETP